MHTGRNVSLRFLNRLAGVRLRLELGPLVGCEASVQPLIRFRCPHFLPLRLHFFALPVYHSPFFIAFAFQIRIRIPLLTSHKFRFLDPLRSTEHEQDFYSGPFVLHRWLPGAVP